MSLLLLFTPQPRPAPITASGTVQSSASLTADVRISDSAIFSESQVAKRRLATDADYQRVLVPLMVGAEVFNIVAQTTRDPETAAIWAVAAIVMTVIAMREVPIAAIVAWLSDKLRPPNA